MGCGVSKSETIAPHQQQPIQHQQIPRQLQQPQTQLVQPHHQIAQHTEEQLPLQQQLKQDQQHQRLHQKHHQPSKLEKQPVQKTLCTQQQPTEQNIQRQQNGVGGVALYLEQTPPSTPSDVPSIKDTTEDIPANVLQSINDIRQNIEHAKSCDKITCERCLQAVDACNELCVDNVNDYNISEKIGDEIAGTTDYCAMFKMKWAKWQMLDGVGGHDSDHREDGFYFINRLTSSSWTLSDKSAAFSEAMDKENCLTAAMEWVIGHRYNKNDNNDWVEAIIYNVLNMLHNCVRNVPTLREKYAWTLPTLQWFSESENEYMKILAFFVLAYLVGKEDAEDKLKINAQSIKLLTRTLKRSLGVNGHLVIVSSFKVSKTAAEYSALELIQGICKLAINDENKALIVQHDGIQIVGSMLSEKSNSVEEQIHATNTLWQLGFLDCNKEKLKKEHNIMQDLTLNSHCKNNKLRKASMGALFEIYGYKLPVEEPDEQVPSVNHGSISGESGHIMISYSWENPSQPVMREMKEQLRERGYTVWMDEDQMAGDIIGAMAEAVEKADVVLACISQGYQDSQHCRSELSYAIELRKKIVPIKVDPQFKQSGWLGLIMAAKLYYTVRQPEEVSVVLPDIVNKELKGVGVSDTADTAATSGKVAPSDEHEKEEKRPAVPALANRVTVKERQLQELADNFPADDGSYKIFCCLLRPHLRKTPAQSK